MSDAERRSILLSLLFNNTPCLRKHKSTIVLFAANHATCSYISGSGIRKKSNPNIMIIHCTVDDPKLLTPLVCKKALTNSANLDQTAS